MKRRVISWMLLMAIGSLLAAGSPQEQDEPLTRGYHQRVLQLDEDVAVRYSLAVPQLESDEIVPLVLALHFGGEVTPYYGMSYLRMLAAPAFRTLRPIIVAPDCPGRGWTDPLSERAMLALLDHALEHWPVDPQRVVVTGFSMGGVGTWFMAGKHPEKFSAAVPVAGWPVGEPDGSVPIYAIHGGRDEVVDIEPTKRAMAKLEEQGADAKLVVVEELTHYQTAAYMMPLRGAAKWLKKLWAGKQDPDDPGYREDAE